MRGRERGSRATARLLESAPIRRWSLGRPCRRGASSTCSFLPARGCDPAPPLSPASHHPISCPSSRLVRSPTWHVVIGTNYGSHVVHATKHFIYFYLGPKAVLIFKSG